MAGRGGEVPGVPAWTTRSPPGSSQPRPSITAGRNVFTYTGVLTGTPNGDAPNLLNSRYSIKAEVEVPQGGGDGMLVTQGGRFARLRLLPAQRQAGLCLEPARPEAGAVGGQGRAHSRQAHAGVRFSYDGLGMGTLAFNSISGLGRSGTGVLKVDGKEVAPQKMERTIPLILAWDENFDVGADTLTGVDDRDYQPPFAFNGTIDKLTITIDRPQLTPADIKKLQEANAGSHKTSESARAWCRTMRMITFAAAVEAGTSLLLLMDPSLFVSLLLGAELARAWPGAGQASWHHAPGAGGGLLARRHGVGRDEPGAAGTAGLQPADHSLSRLPGARAAARRPTALARGCAACGRVHLAGQRGARSMIDRRHAEISDATTGEN